MRLSNKLLAVLFLLLSSPVYAQEVSNASCSISGSTITCPSGSLTASSSPTGAAGGVLSGTYPNPGYAVQPLVPSNNLSDLISAATARTNLGLGALATVVPGTGVATALAVNVGTAGSPVVNGGVLGTPLSGVATNLTGTASGLTAGSFSTGDASNLNAGTLLYARLPVAARTMSTPANPTGTASIAGVMMGTAGTITPLISGKIFFTVTGQYFQSTSTGGCSATLRYGTGSAPANNAAITGTAIGNGVAATLMLSSQSIPFSVSGYVSGFTLSTAVWIDLGLAAVAAGTCSMFNLTVTALEQL